MSQRDLVAELQAARTPAPADVRARVRAIAAIADRPGAPRHAFTWRRALVLAVPVAAAVAAAIVFTRPSSTSDQHAIARPAVVQGERVVPKSAAGASSSFAPLPTPKRAVDYDASLALRLRDANAVSDAVKRALRIASSLGGYPTAVHASTHGASGQASLTLKIPRAHVQAAITRLAALGTITSENVELRDAQAGLNADARTVARLQRELRTLRALRSTAATRRQIATLTARIVSLQRADASRARGAHYATVALALSTRPAAAATKHRHGALHGLGIAFHWIGIGAVYALALGVPLVLLLLAALLVARAVRRRREDALLRSA